MRAGSRSASSPGTCGRTAPHPARPGRSPSTPPTGGHGIAAKLLDGLTARLTAERGITELETTITLGNTASERLFTSFAERHGAGVSREVLSPADLFPDGPHDPEVSTASAR